MPPRRDPLTIDLFRDYAPAPVVERFDADAVKAFSLAAKLSKAVSLTLAGTNRAETAEAMSEYLGDEVSKGMLDNYASQAKEHSISAVRLAALVHVTGDVRALNALLEDAGLIVIPKQYEPLILDRVLEETIERLERQKQAARAQWKASR